MKSDKRLENVLEYPFLNSHEKSVIIENFNEF